MRQLCDLHVHSNYSDGTCSPSELTALARHLGSRLYTYSQHSCAAGCGRCCRFPGLLRPLQSLYSCPADRCRSGIDNDQRSCLIKEKNEQIALE